MSLDVHECVERVLTWSDEDVRAYLRELDESAVEVTDWEAVFIESCLERRVITRRQREVIGGMMARYGEAPE